MVSGVPQGSVLGPLLFIIYINDLAMCSCCPGSKLIMYADDVLLYRTIFSIADFDALQVDLDTIKGWSVKNFLELNHSKCKYLIMSRKKKVSTPSAPLLLGGVPFDRVYSFKYLGVLLNHDLTWSGHTMMVCNKARKILGLIYRKFYNASSNTLLQLYISSVRPHLEYASPVWSPHLAKDTDLIEGVQKFALRIASKQWSKSYYDLLRYFKIPTLEKRRNDARLVKIIHKYCYFPGNIFDFITLPLHQNLHSLTLNLPFTRTNAFTYSFIPFTIKLWNQLDSTTVSASSLQSFNPFITNDGFRPRPTLMQLPGEFPI